MIECLAARPGEVQAYIDDRRNLEALVSRSKGGKPAVKLADVNHRSGARDMALI